MEKRSGCRRRLRGRWRRWARCPGGRAMQVCLDKLARGCMMECQAFLVMDIGQIPQARGCGTAKQTSPTPLRSVITDRSMGFSTNTIEPLEILGLSSQYWRRTRCNADAVEALQTVRHLLLHRGRYQHLRDDMIQEAENRYGDLSYVLGGRSFCRRPDGSILTDVRRNSNPMSKWPGP